MNSDYKGKILISTPDISGDIFSRSVVLIIDHNENGAFGLILNKRNNELSRKVRKIFGFSADIYEGGPVENNKTFIIAKGAPVSDYYISINEDFYITEDMENKDYLSEDLVVCHKGDNCTGLVGLARGLYLVQPFAVLHPALAHAARRICRWRRE